MGKKSSQYNPEILGSFTNEITTKANIIGLTVEGINDLNVARYINKLQILQVDGMQLSIMPEQTKEMVLTAVYNKPEAIQYAIEQDIHAISIALNKNPKTIQYIRNKTDDIIYMALDLDPNTLLYIPNYTIKHAKYAIERKVSILNDIDKKYIDEDMIMFILDLYKDGKITIVDFLLNNDMFYQYNNKCVNPLSLFSNNKIRKYALELNPIFLSYLSPHELNKKELCELINIPSYFYYMESSEYYINKEIAQELINADYDICKKIHFFKILDIDCIYPEFLKTIIDNITKHRTVNYSDLCYDLRNRVDIVNIINENISYIFNHECVIDLCYMSGGFSNKSVISEALRRDKTQSKYLNFWKTKVKNR